MIRKQSSEGIGYSVVELNDTRHVFAAGVPRAGSGLTEQAWDALETIRAVIEEEGTRGSIVSQAVFIRQFDQIAACRQIMRDFYGEELPATTYVFQPPCEGKEVAIEAMGVGRGRDGVEIIRRSERVVITRHNGIAWIHVAPVFPACSAAGVYDRSLNAFQIMSNILESQGFCYDQVIRTWLYLGDIVGPEADTQRYKELNRARTDFYTDIPFARGLTPPGYNGAFYPASTGIGACGREVLMTCIALATDRDDVLLVPLENPLQTSAFDYGQHYSPESPKFARAMAVVAGPCATIFVSGTASITQSETRFVGDVEGQTQQTLDNIEALISEDNLARHGAPGAGATLNELALLRVYVKNQEDYAKTQAVCEKRLGELPSIYAVADVCRPELLVEIEGIAMSARCAREEGA